MRSGDLQPRIAILSVMAIASGGLILWAFGGLRGEVFLVTGSGNALVAPGADIWVTRTNQKKNWSGLFNTITPLTVKQFQSLADLTQRETAVEKLAAKGKISNRDKAKASDALGNLASFRGRTYCIEVAVDVSKYLHPATAKTTADRQGRFSLAPLLPGHYIIWASGQAGTDRAEWMEEVNVGWRSEVQLSNPFCQYSTQ